MVTVKVLYFSDKSAKFVFEDRTCTTKMQSVSPFDYGLEQHDRIILVSHGYAAFNTFLNGKETADGLAG